MTYKQLYIHFLHEHIKQDDEDPVTDEDVLVHWVRLIWRHGKVAESEDGEMIVTTQAG